MTIDNFLSNISEIFEDSSIESEGGTLKFKELDEWDSMTSLSLIAVIDEKYNVVLTDKDIINCETLADIYAVVNQKKNA